MKFKAGDKVKRVFGDNYLNRKLSYKEVFDFCKFPREDYIRDENIKSFIANLIVLNTDLGLFGNVIGYSGDDYTVKVNFDFGLFKKEHFMEPSQLELVESSNVNPAEDKLDNYPYFRFKVNDFVEYDGNDGVINRTFFSKDSEEVDVVFKNGLRGSFSSNTNGIFLDINQLKLVHRPIKKVKKLVYFGVESKPTQDGFTKSYHSTRFFKTEQDAKDTLMQFQKLGYAQEYSIQTAEIEVDEEE